MMKNTEDNKLNANLGDYLKQLVKFGIVGLSNTLISYIAYALLVFCDVDYLMANFLGFIVSVQNAFYWNNKYVFKTEEAEKRVWWKALIKTFISYVGTGLILSNILLVFWIEILHVPEMIGPLLSLIITIPLNFVLNKYWAFRAHNR